MTSLTPEQEALIPVYQEKWKEIALSTESINIQRAEAAIKNAYAIMGRKAPRICFRGSPDAAIALALKAEQNPVTSKIKLSFNRVERIRQQRRHQAGNNQINPWIDLRSGLIKESTYYQLKDNDNYRIMFQKITNVNWIRGVKVELQSCLQELVQELREKPSLRGYYCYLFSPIEAAVTSIWLDFCSSVLHLPVEERKWEAFASVVKECGWIFCTDEICVVCNRPRLLNLDSENRLHAEGEPAIEFADGYSIYAHHGVILPEQYGQVYPNEWRSQWLLEETNAELRRVLIQRIGYARLCQELDATPLDYWQEYQLLRINANLDRERMHLLKMTCPSTGYIHVMRVPPNVQSAREAIKWVNWGVDPEEFSSQS